MTDRAGPATFTWDITHDASTMAVQFQGEVDENVDFSALPSQLAGEVVFHLEGVKRINSCGVREWINFIRDLPRVTHLVFSHCSTVVVNQLNMIYNFRGSASVRSFYLPYICPACDHEAERLIDVASELPDGFASALPEHQCDVCSTAMEIDEIPERYLSFLADEGRARPS